MRRTQRERWGDGARAVRLRSERGFTIIEIMVAAMILVVGVLGLLAMMDGATAQTSRNKIREGATNLAREVVEDVDSLPYSAIDPTTLAQTLQSKPGLATTGSGWTVSRRGIQYTLSTSVCNIDDPRDGTGAHDATFCSGGAAAGSTDQQPIDYKRVTVTITWSSAIGSEHVQQTTLMFPGGTSSNVPTITNLTTPTTSPVTNQTTTAVGFTATTSGTPSGVEWFVNDNPAGTATGSGTNWTFTWSLANVPDGTYVISARAFDSTGAYGQPYEVTFTINRQAPAAPGNFVAGWDPLDSSVDSEWIAPTDGDIIGYHVYRQQTAPTTGPITQVNCGTVASPVYLTTNRECTDASPLAGSTPTITPNASSAAYSNSSKTLTVPAPAGIVAGDLLLATLVTSGSTSGPLPTGWTLGPVSWSSSFNVQVVTAYKIATSSEPSSYTFTGSATLDASGTIVDYSGVDQTNPIDTSQTASGSSGNAVGPSVTTTAANDRVVEAVGFTGAGASLWSPTPPSGMTTRAVANSNSTVTFVAGKAQAAAGASGTFTTVPNGIDTGWSAQTIALKPAAVNLAVNYWVNAVDYDPTGNLRDGSPSNVVNAYASDNPPSPPTWQTTPVTNLSDGTTQLNFNVSPGDPDTGDYVAFYRIYRDGQRYDRTGSGTDTTYVDPNPGGTTHTYQITAVDSHEEESAKTSAVTG